MCNSKGRGLHHTALGFTFPNVTLYAVEERQQEYIRHASIASLPHTQNKCSQLELHHKLTWAAFDFGSRAVENVMEERPLIPEKSPPHWIEAHAKLPFLLFRKQWRKNKNPLWWRQSECKGSLNAYSSCEMKEFLCFYFSSMLFPSSHSCKDSCLVLIHEDVRRPM